MVDGGTLVDHDDAERHMYAGVNREGTPGRKRETFRCGATEPLAISQYNTIQYIFLKLRQDPASK